jgi:UDP-glucose 4-epimerase
MNILIIGSDSFIAKAFIQYNSDRFIKGISRTIISFPNEYIINDLFKIEEKYFLGVDIVINFAAIVHRPDIKDNTIYNEINYRLAVLNAQKAERAGVKMFIQMSTIGVYGDEKNININTSYNPQNPYSISKCKADEEILSMRTNSFKICIIRSPMVYGGGQSPGNMMKLIKLVDKCLILPFKNINNSRDYINIRNLVQYLTIIVEKQLDGIYLICDQEPVSIEYLVKTILKYLNKKNYLVKIPDFSLKMFKLIRPNEFQKLYNSMRIQANFPYEHLVNRFTVEQGISEMIDWYKNQKE